MWRQIGENGTIEFLEPPIKRRSDVKEWLQLWRQWCAGQNSTIIELWKQHKRKFMRVTKCLAFFFGKPLKMPLPKLRKFRVHEFELKTTRWATEKASIPIRAQRTIISFIALVAARPWWSIEQIRGKNVYGFYLPVFFFFLRSLPIYLSVCMYIYFIEEKLANKAGKSLAKRSFPHRRTQS